MKGIYLIRCTVNNKVYVGQTKDIKKRYNTHIQELRRGRHSNSYLQEDFDKYGEKNFVCKTIYELEDEKLDRQKLYNLEIYYISLYNSTNRLKGYNIESGGNGSGRASKETCLKLSESHKGKKMSKEVRQKLSEMRKGKPSHWRGKKQSKEHSEKRINQQFGKVWVNNGITSKFVSKEESKILLNQGFKLGRIYFTRNTGKYEFYGEKCSLCEIARRCGIDRSLLFYRLKNGWSMEKATTTPVKK